MSKKTIVSIIITAIIIISVVLPNQRSDDQDEHSMHINHTAKSHAIEWTPSTRNALVKEMQSITVNYQDLVSALAQGNWEKVVESSHAIYSSFILKQELSREDMEALHRILPDRFIEMDKQFHEQAQKLETAAQNHDPELAVIYSGKLLEGCVSCHQTYAHKRFPGLEKKKATVPEH
ncbi:MAG: cytochrome c [FCB group bacterium]|nr:cytochrome c [FCB group bacterium]